MSTLQDASNELVLINRDDLLGSKGVQVPERTCPLLPEISAQSTKDLRSFVAVLRGQSQVKSKKQHWPLLADLCRSIRRRPAQQ